MGVRNGSVVVDELAEVLRRQRDAVTLVDHRLEALAALVASGDASAIPAAVAEVQRATERAAFLALVRSIALTTEGRSPDLSPEEVAAGLDGSGVPAGRVRPSHDVAVELRLMVERANRRRACLEESLSSIAPDALDLGPSLRA